MLQTLSRNHKTIAWFLVNLFYSQLILSATEAKASDRYFPVMEKSYSRSWNVPVKSKSPFTGAYTGQRPENISVSRKVQQKQAPVTVKQTFTTGPTQPEMQSFQSVNTNNMVDLFTGDFSYNIPLLDVGGYPVNIHYQSGVTMDQEASWVGLGWNINPGVINRNMRGLPDDFEGADDAVTKTVSMKPNKTFGVTIGGNIELGGAPVNLDASIGVFHNNYKGWGIERALNANINAGIGAKGSLTAGLSLSNNTQTGIDISPSMGFQLGSSESTTRGNITIGTNYNSRTGIQNLQITGEVRQYRSAYKQQSYSGRGITSTISFCKPSYTPTISIPYTSSQFSFTTKVGALNWALHPNAYIRAYSSIQEIKPNDKTVHMPAYGYMYFEKAKERNVLLDFNREKDIAYSENTPHIAVPYYTYDTWSISGEGTGGMFRPYRGDIGYIYDHAMATKSNSDRFSLDLGFGNVVQTGVDLNKVTAATKSYPWESDNTFKDVVPFKEQDTTFENVYFKNPGEKTAVNKDYLRAVGDDTLMRVALSPGGQNNPVVTASRQVSLFKNGRAVATRTFDLSSLRATRDKRTQVISWLNAEQATYAALDKKIRSYPINTFPGTSCSNYDEIPRVDDQHKIHHLSEITVLNADGRRYVYGIPVYNKTQIDVTMATDKGDPATGLVSYTSNQNSVNNTSGKDGYFNKEVLPAYSHSFLLSGILSPDYVDITGDGITEDDNGDAVKFNYSRIYSLETPYRWRAPYQANMASYNEGLKTDSRDEKGSYTYGEREVWYLNSIESKTMIATFVLDTDGDRKDSYGVNDENGGQNPSQKLYRLKEINLYAKADYLQNGGNAKPIKTVHFEYSYELCKKNLASLSDSGKLTLKKIWFSYNKNNKGKRNPYIFTYNNSNPDFNSKWVDRWGNYKDPQGNPGASGKELTNADYPYTLQAGVKSWDSASAADNSAPWTLSQIKLPSGGSIKVTYESDDYAYVQNKRAMQFFSIAGFGSSAGGAIQQSLYPTRTYDADYEYVFVNVTDPVHSRQDVARKYLEGVNQLFFKLAVNMPGDRWGSGYEMVPVYADIDDYGVRSDNVIWIRVKPVTGHESPFVTAALQFLRLNLYSKAYPFSEPGDNLDIKAIVGLLVSVSGGLVKAFQNFNKQSRTKSNWCNSLADGDISFVRLDNPVYKKLGGGLRVKKVELFDNWNKMTGQQESVYGQTYDYSTEIDINGVPTHISSGVATYEPVIGNDENPFRVPQKLYTVKVGAMAPADYMYTEEPFAETFFPAPMVGYSKVRVQTINNNRKSANGFEESEFYTSKDFPVLVEYTPLDNDSKKTYDPKISNLLSFNSKHYVTLSQGFKIELNDMNGKPKSQATWSQNDLTHPISYTYNYYRLKNDNAAQPQLSNKVAVADASGHIDSAEIGKEVEVMVDVREQTSTTQSGSIELNAIWANIFPPVFFGTAIPLPSNETDRYRAIAVMKVVNRYGLLDSLIHIEKGSKVTTRNMVYDAETGDVLLSQTNNEFDDPLYNFNYPAHWAYSGMGPAYKNIGTVLTNVHFRNGILFDNNNNRVPARYFESGDEILVHGYDQRLPYTNDNCAPLYYLFNTANGESYTKVWAIDASRGKEGQQGIYFIDKDGIAYSADADEIRIIRSGKRNMAGVSIGALTSLQSPVRNVSGVSQLVFDENTGVVAASAARFKDLWKVDSTNHAKDTQVLVKRKMDLQTITLKAKDHFTIGDEKDCGDCVRQPVVLDDSLFEASSKDDGDADLHKRSWLKFDFSGIPRGAVIESADLYLTGDNYRLQRNWRNTNACYLERVKGTWVRDAINSNSNMVSYYFWDPDNVLTDYNTQVTLPETVTGISSRNDTPHIASMAQAMLDDYYNNGYSPSVRIRLVDFTGVRNDSLSMLTYNSEAPTAECPGTEGDCTPKIVISYYPGCNDGTQPVEDSCTTLHGAPATCFFCTDVLSSTYLCKPNINDTAVNFYRYGILGNWRIDRAYTYYGRRQESDPSTTTDIRTFGTIKDFMPYWNFSNAVLTPSTDTMRWVWNSEITLVNSKGLEIENHDPLNRYNSGQYGYDHTLPVAVTQNSKNREMFFEGFEDYGYSIDTCKRCDVNRFIELADGGTLDNQTSHTGVYSLRLDPNQAVTRTFPVASIEQDTMGISLHMKEDSVPIITSTVNGTGLGLSAYSNLTAGGLTGCTATGDVANISMGYTSIVDYQTSTNPTSPIPGICRDADFEFAWNGYIQARYTGTYKFWVTADDYMSLWITKDGVSIDLLDSTAAEVDHTWANAIESHTIQLQAGELYPISVLLTEKGTPYQAKLEWEGVGNPQGREVVPKSQLYADNVDVNTEKNLSIVYDTTWCVKFNNPTVQNVTLKRFSPLQGRQVVVGAWVKEPGLCATGSYTNEQLEVWFDGDESSKVILKPSGNIIEGWQRIEGTLTIPQTASGMSYRMVSPTNNTVYFDDLRIHPFNGNMKSFVYNPVNLRLMAELDENNYATFYEYDDEGTLIRVKKETEQGVKTIRETRSALQKE